MKQQRREELLARRKQLQQKIEIDQRLDAIRREIEILDRHGVAYELIFDDRPQVEWLHANFPIGGGLFSVRVDWPRVTNAVKGPDPLAESPEVTSWLEQLTVTQALGNPQVLIIRGNGVHPAISVAWADVSKYPEVVCASADNWVFCQPDGWLIEYLQYEAGWWWGRHAAV